ncbi:hypothetical protein [Rufibacter aurantiacus]|uniref:hypothetical protein n=1 Tax=Rufibacter aurantiacus TaxID=2817374 RepID=UPI001B3150AC|nr:hypothetical protein [Rufibacter aurantiacus]
MTEVAVLFIYGVIGATVGLLVAVLIRKMVIAFFGKSMISVGISYCLVLIGVILVMNMSHSKLEAFSSIFRNEQKPAIEAKV